MALQLTIKSDTGLNIENVYVHIDEYSCNKDNLINARVRAYVSRELMKGNSAPIGGSEELITLQGDYSDSALNSKKQIYNYIKTTDKFKEAIDVLE